MPDFEGERWIQQPNRWLRPAAVGLLVLGLALSIVMGVLAKAPGIGSPLIVFGAMGAFFGRQVALWPSRRRARVRADARGLHADGELIVPRDAIARAYVQPFASGQRH